MDKLAAHSETSELAGNSKRATFLVRLFLPGNTHQNIKARTQPTNHTEDVPRIWDSTL